MRASLSALQRTNKANERESITIGRKYVCMEARLVKAIDHSRRFELNIETLCLENMILADKNTFLVSDEKRA